MRRKIQSISEWNIFLASIYKQVSNEIFKDEVCRGKKPTYEFYEQKYFTLSETIKKSKPSQEKKINSREIEEEQSFLMKLQRVFSFINDTRKQVKDARFYPYCCVGLVSGKFGIDTYFGSGCLVNSRIVLTCAHNLYHRDDKKKCENIKFTPGLNGQGVMSYTIKNSYYPPEYEKGSDAESNKYDIAVLELNVDLKDKHGYLGIDTSDNSLDYDGDYEICGYPSKKQVPDKDQTMWFARGPIKSRKEKFIFYQIPTETGQSGSPFFKKNELVVGTHIGDTNRNNVSIRLTNEIRRMMNEWAGKSGKLDLSYKKVSEVGMKSLEKYSKDHVITFLNLSSNQIMEKHLRDLSIGEWKQLKELKLNKNKIEDQGMKLIGHHNFFPNLQELSLVDNKITKEGVKEMSLHAFSYLRFLDLGHNPLGDEAMKFLKKFTSLLTLKLENTGLTKDGIYNLSQGEFPYLQSLTLNDNKIEDISMKHLSKFRVMEELYLSRTGLTEKGLQILSSGQFKYLYEIWLSQNPIKDSGIKFLAKYKKTLQCIDLSHTQITDAGAEILSKLDLPALQDLNIWGNKIGEIGIKRMEQMRKKGIDVIYAPQNLNDLK